MKPEKFLFVSYPRGNARVTTFEARPCAVDVVIIKDGDTFVRSDRPGVVYAGCVLATGSKKEIRNLINTQKVLVS